MNAAPIYTTEAIWQTGALHPVEPLNLPNGQRVRIVVHQLESPSPGDRSAAMSRLRAGIASMGFRSEGPYPHRDELHERR